MSDAAFQRAVAAFQAGDRARAEAACRELLVAQPNHAGALKLVGTIARLEGRAADAAASRRGLAHALRLAGRWTEAVEEYRGIADDAPQDQRAQADLGAALVKAGASEQAIAVYRRAVALDPANLRTRAALGQLFQDRVRPWHFVMLNDEPRNAAYDAAIRRAVRPGDIVLDIGTGSGLLAMMAARAGAAHVYACEMVPVIAEKAREIVAANGFADRVTILPKNSLDLRIGRDLPRKADVLISEIVDVVLLGENVLPTLAHARRDLIAENATVIPRTGALYSVLVESDGLYRQDRVGEIAGFDIGAFNEFSRYSHFTADLRDFPHRPLSEPVEVFRFDLAGAATVPRRRMIDLPVTTDGTCHALVSWFVLMLDDETLVSSDPATGAHWMQAVHLWDKPRAVAPGDVMRVAASHDMTHVHFLLDPDEPRDPTCPKSP